MNLVNPNEASSDEWLQGSLASRGTKPLTWYKVRTLLQPQKQHM